jgi:hypothetical protein
MRRIRWIWRFSFLQLPIFVLLIWYGCPYRPTWVGWMRPTAGQERRFGINLEEIDMAYLPFPEQIAVGFNAPPALVGELMNVPIYYATRAYFTGAERELISHALTAVMIPFFWVWAIRITWIRRITRPVLSIFLKIFFIFAIALLSLLAILTLASFFLRDDHYSIVRDLLFLLWFCWGIYVLVLRIRNRSEENIIAAG